MLIVDAQIHLWEKGTPSAHHRQEPYSAEQAIAGMDEAGVDRALIHPVLWDPDSNELAIMGWFYLDDPNGRDLVAHWKERPGMLGLRFYTNERPATPRTNTRSAVCIRTCTAVSTPSVPSGCSGAPTSPACPAPGGNA